MAFTSTTLPPSPDRKFRGTIRELTETGVANTLLTASITLSNMKRVLGIFCSYSAAPTQAGVSIEFVAVAGAAFRHQLNLGAANARHTNWFPPSDFVLGTNDVLEVIAPAGGVGITASVTVIIEDV